MKKGYKLCPYCANEIKEGAIKCQYCKEFLNVGNELNEKNKEPEEKKVIKKTTNKAKEVKKVNDNQKLLKKTEREWRFLTYLKEIKYGWLFLWIFLSWATLLVFDFFNDELWHYRLNGTKTLVDGSFYYYNKVEFIRYCVFLLGGYFVYKIVGIFYKGKNEFVKVGIYILSLVVFYTFTTLVVQYHDGLIYFMLPGHFFGSFLDVLSKMMNLS